MPIRAYIEKRGLTQQEFAKQVGVSQGMIYQWIQWLEGKDNGTRVTAEKALEIETATKGAVKAKDLRPDVFGKRRNGGK